MTTEMLNARCLELIAESKARSNYINESISYLKLLHKKGELVGVEPKWHVTQRGIDLDSQRYESVPNEYLETMNKGFTILKNVNCKSILNSISKDDASIYRRRKVFNTWYNDRHVSEILFCWLNGKKLIPPTLMFNGMKNYLVDGKHRFNVAYSLGAETLPILVSNEHLDEVRRRLV